MTKHDIIDIYIEIVKSKKMTPTRADLFKLNVTQDMYRHHFKTLEILKDQARKKAPDVFKFLLDEQVFTPKIFKKLKGDVAKYKKFVVTTAVTGMPLHKKFYLNLKAYCKKNKALLLILPSSDPAIKGWELDGELSSEKIVFDDLALNSNLCISAFKTSSKQTNPLTGIKRIGQRERSMIIASPKQFLEYVPTANDKYSHALMTTGAVTLPMYRSTERYMSQRTAYIAEFDHKIGALVVEIKDDKYFQFRQIQAEYGSGKIIDLGTVTTTEGSNKEIPEAIVLGDIHVGHTDPIVQKATDQLLKDLKPKRIFLHDLFDGESVNHHMKDQLITKAHRTITLLEEVNNTMKYLETMKKKHPYVNEWIIVRSNHDDFLDRYLQSGDYVKDSINSKFAHKLALAKLENKRMALDVALECVGLDKSKITFLKVNDSYKVKGIECGVHGHLGLNGSKAGTNASMEIGYGAGIFGHSHTAGILRDVYRVGTSTVLRQGYNNGASNWTQTHCVLYSNGSRQLLNIIKGSYK